MTELRTRQLNGLTILMKRNTTRRKEYIKYKLYAELVTCSIHIDNVKLKN